MFLNHILFPFTVVQIPIGQSQKENLGKNYEKTLVPELVQKWLQIVGTKKLIFGSLQLFLYDLEVNISSSILLCILGKLAVGGFVAVAVGVSDM